MRLKPISVAFGVFLVGLLASLAVAGAQGSSGEPTSWNPQRAAAYLDARAEWWAKWPNAARDHGTFCVSCHTAVPYALARPALRTALGERGRTANEIRLLDNVAKRVTLWKELAPLYSDQRAGLPKTSESRATEAILNALILSSRDAADARLTDDTRTAFDHMWALQMKTGPLNGAWAWLNFGLEPWESNDAPYFGASLAALAIGTAPEQYASSAAIQTNLTLLVGYLQRHSERQPAMNRLMALWASTRVAGLLSPEQSKAIVDSVLAVQDADGGWSMAALGTFKHLDTTPVDTRSDGYATGLVTLVLQEAGHSNDARVRKGLDWLKTHQDPGGQWSAASLNKVRDPLSDAGRFMSDAATAWAVMSLTARH